MSLDLLERGARALGPLRGEVVFLGGATLVLWIDDPAAPPPRPTKDVDVVVEVITRPALHAFEQRMRDVGFTEDRDSGVICRWRHRADRELILDAMPAEPSLVGFGGRWQREAVPHAVTRRFDGSWRTDAGRCSTVVTSTTWCSVSCVRTRRAEHGSAQ